MVGFHNLLLKWIIVQCVQYGNDTILEYQWPVALFMAYHETYDKKMSLFICCATLSRLLVLLYRWRSGHTFTPGFSKYVKFVICVRFLCSKTNLSKGRCLFFFTWKTQVSMVFFISKLIHSWDFFQGHDANTTESGGIQRSTQRLRRSHRVATCFAAAQRLGVKVEKPRCCFTMFFFLMFVSSM